jgi:segregation and condensation protein B
MSENEQTDVQAEQVSSAGEAAAAAPAEAGGDLPAGETMPLRQVVEALLFASDSPISVGKLAETVGLDSTKPVKEVVAELNAEYAARLAAYRIEERAGGYQLLTLPQYADYIQRLVRKKDEGRLTPASLETLAIVSYKQPVIRADIEAVRGVACGEVLRSLMEHNLIKIVGRAEIVGRPMLYGTTRYFLEVFGLASIKDLPKAEALKEPK